MSKAAFQSDKLFCPYPTGPHTLCGSTRWKYLEKVGPYRIRFQCKDCRRTLQYDYSANPGNPYAPFANKSWFKSALEWVTKQGLVTRGLTREGEKNG